MEYRSINKIYYYMETVSLKKKKKGGVIRLNTGQYTCLEVFAKAKTKEEYQGCFRQNTCHGKRSPDLLLYLAEISGGARIRNMNWNAAAAM